MENTELQLLRGMYPDYTVDTLILSGVRLARLRSNEEAVQEFNAREKRALRESLLTRERKLKLSLHLATTVSAGIFLVSVPFEKPLVSGLSLLGTFIMGGLSRLADNSSYTFHKGNVD